MNARSFFCFALFLFVAVVSNSIKGQAGRLWRVWGKDAVTKSPDNTTLI